MEWSIGMCKKRIRILTYRYITFSYNKPNFWIITYGESVSELLDSFDDIIYKYF
jgi:hypothetical protein